MSLAQRHPIENFWSHAYARYQIEPGVFAVPDMVDPILSPRFGKKDGPHLNLIQTVDAKVATIPGYSLRNNFFLCTLKTKEVRFDHTSFKVLDLAEAKKQNHFWQLLKNGFAKDFHFLPSLMDFLPTLTAKFKVGYLMEDQIPYACVVVGHTETEAVLLSGMIKDTHRDQKKSRELNSLVDYIATQEGIEEYFFWTMSERLIRYVDHVDRYLIYTRNH